MPTPAHRLLRSTWKPTPEQPQLATRSAAIAAADRHGDYDQLPKRERNWLVRFTEIEAFVLHGRLPREKGSPADEAALAVWARRQRQNVASLCGYQTELLNSIDFEWNPREESFADRATEFQAFMHTHGRPPRVRAEESTERSLGRWMAQQQRRRRDGRLTSARVAELARLGRKTQR